MSCKFISIEARLAKMYLLKDTGGTKAIIS